MEAGNLLKNLESVVTCPPTYLQAVYSDIHLENIELVYIQKVVEDYLDSEKETLPGNDSEITATLDVTGSPLQVDLSGNETLIDTQIHTVQQCSENETKHLPVDLKLARSYLNQRLRTDHFSNAPIFVICDGENPQKTVLIGAHRTRRLILTCLLNVVGLYHQRHEKVSLEAMRKSHLASAGAPNLKIDYLVHFKYYMYGTLLRNLENIYNVDYLGSICIDLSVNEECDLELPRNMKKMKKKLILQIVIGHKLSAVDFLWEDICLLRNYVVILSDIEERDKGKTKLSATFTSLSEIQETVKNIVSSMTTLGRQTKSLFDLKNIRKVNILDELWNILKCCENLSVLRIAFHHFFEELAASGTNVKIPEGNTTSVSVIVNGILGGKLAVPTITHRQALEFLFEIGAEKLKNDYRAIIKQYYVTSNPAVVDSAISVKWNQLNEKFPSEKNTPTVMPHISKLSYLGKLHLAVEMVYLVRGHLEVPQETFDNFCRCVYMNYVEKEDAATPAELQTNHIYELDVDIDTIDENYIKKELPFSWTVQMKSTLRKAEITTVYHLSKYNILPTTIYDKYDIPMETIGDESLYHVYKFECHKDSI